MEIVLYFQNKVHYVQKNPAISRNECKKNKIDKQNLFWQNKNKKQKKVI